MRAIWPDGGNAGSHPRRLRRSISSFARAKDRQAPLLRQKTRRRPPRLAFLRKQSQTHPAGCAAGLAAISHASPPCLRHRLRGGTCCNFACRPALPQAQIARRRSCPMRLFLAPPWEWSALEANFRRPPRFASLSNSAKYLRKMCGGGSCLQHPFPNQLSSSPCLMRI